MDNIEFLLTLLGFVLFPAPYLYKEMKKKLSNYTLKGRKIILTSIPIMGLLIALSILGISLGYFAVSFTSSLWTSSHVFATDGMLYLVGTSILASGICLLLSSRVFPKEIKQLQEVIFTKSFQNDFKSPIK